MIIDFHTHIFPDHIAQTAIPFLEEEGDIKAFLDGTKSSLLQSMDEAGIDQSVVCSIATKPAQFQAIFQFSQEIASERIIPFPSVHPLAPEVVDQIDQIAQAGFQGIKMHAYYQNFYLMEAAMEPLYEAMSRNGLIVLMHTGFDIAFPHIRRCDPQQIVELSRKYPDLKLVTSHLGAWQLWDEVEAMLIGRPIYMDISYALEFIDVDRARRMMMSHPEDYLLYASDSPWTSQSATIELVKRLKLPTDLEAKLLGSNAANLLNA